MSRLLNDGPVALLAGMRLLRSSSSLRARGWFTPIELDRLTFGGGPRSKRGGRWRTLRNRWRQLERAEVRRILYGDPRAAEPTGILTAGQIHGAVFRGQEAGTW